MKPIVLSLCDRTGVMVQPWLDAGYECWIVDMQHEPGQTIEGNLVRFGADVLTFTDWRDVELAIVFAFPACTNLAGSGALHFKKKGLEKLHDSLGLVIACKAICEASGAPWMLENPVGTLSTYWRKPDRYVHPWQFAGWNEDVERENYTKKTGLWVGGGFQFPRECAAPEPHRDDIHKMPPSADRGDKRSVTPTGFAKAVFEANRRSVKALALVDQP